jgi:hypothetical protein
MTTTRNANKGACYCGRRTGPSAEARQLDMCDRCMDWSEWENMHSDYAHDTQPELTEDTERASCLVCRFGTEEAYQASFATRTRNVTTVAASTVDKAGTHECPKCHHTLPVTKFPTKRLRMNSGATGPINEQVRDFRQCRSCRDGR